MLARYTAAEVFDFRAEGAGLDEFEINSAFALAEERDATANQHWVNSGQALVDQTQRGRFGEAHLAIDRDVANK